MREELAKFISNNEKLFKQHNLKLIYEAANEEYEMMTAIWSLTELFYESGIDPLTYGPEEVRLKEIPSYYIAYSDIIPKEIPEGVTSIGTAAFAATGGFNEMRLPNSLKVIDQQAFSHSNLREIIIPENVEFIDNRAFAGCSQLKKITILSPKIKFGVDVFDKCYSLRVIESKNPVLGGVVPPDVKVKAI